MEVRAGPHLIHAKDPKPKPLIFFWKMFLPVAVALYHLRAVFSGPLNLYEDSYKNNYVFFLGGNWIYIIYIFNF